MRAVLQPVRQMFSQQVVGILHGNSQEIRGGYLAQLCPSTALWVIFPQQGAQAMSKGVLVGTGTNPIREQANNSHVGGQQSSACAHSLGVPDISQMSSTMCDLSLLVGSYFSPLTKSLKIGLLRFRLLKFQVAKESR